MTEPTLIGQLADFASQTTFDTLPEGVVTSCRQRVLDTLGICVAASTLDTSRAVTRYATSQGGRAEAHAVGVAHPLPSALAALVNGTLAHSLDYDDTHLPSVLHPSATIVPACLAAAEASGATGRQTLAAVASGLEICVRLGMAGYDRAGRNSTYFDRGQHATSICGAIGAAGAVTPLLGGDATTTGHAMAIAASMASGIIESNRTGGTVKRIHCGWAAHAALSAAGLAIAGITGAPTALEGRFGLFTALLDGHYDAEAITGGLGTEWSVPGIYFKPYPANHFTHAGIDAAIALRRRGLVPDQVASLVLGVPGPVLHTVGSPIEVKRTPMTAYQAQFSGPYTVVAGLLGGHGLGVGLEDFTDQLAQDPARRALMAKVDVVEDARCSELFPDSFPAVLTARLTDGTEMTERVDQGRGGAARPLTDGELAVKFRDNARRVLSPAALADLEAAVEALADLDDVGACLRPAGTPVDRGDTPS